MASGVCAYCGVVGQLTREHVMPAWLGRELTDHPSVTPAMGRHRFGGALVVEDVCAGCNNGALGNLDAVAKGFWDARSDYSDAIDSDTAGHLERWAGKICFNAQRAVFREGTAGDEPRMPGDAVTWMLRGGTPPESLRVSVTRMPPDHRDAEAVGVFNSRRTALPRRYIKLRIMTFFVAWDPPGQPGIAAHVASEDVRRVPARPMTPRDAGISVPMIDDPELLLRGFWNDQELLEAMARRYPA